MSKNRIERTYCKESIYGEAKTRKHIILLDGTWNDETGINSDGNVTNIVHLKRILKNDSENQIVTYHRGIGNDNENSRIKKVLKGATGADIDDIITNAYAKFVQNWHKGDRIYIFGFSRGAATARLLASKIQKEGIPYKIKISFRSSVNKETNVVEQRVEKYQVASKKPPFSTDIEFLGVWDTVAALGAWTNFMKFLGINKTNIFQDFHIAPNIKKAVHLVAIDETRSIFSAALMNYKENVTHEVWFPGVHSDIGGSYPVDEIAQVSLYYMLKNMEEWAEERELEPFLINKDMRAIYTSEKVDRAHFHFHGEGLGKSMRKIGVQVNGKIDPSRAPKFHKLLKDIIDNNSAYAVFTIDGDNDAKEQKKTANFDYKPFHIEELPNDESEYYY